MHITWVRHGESISQMIEGANDDFPLEESKDKFLAYRTKIMEEEFGNYKDFPKLKEAFEHKDDINIIPYNDLQVTEDILKPFNKKKNAILLVFYSNVDLHWKKRSRAIW